MPGLLPPVTPSPRWRRWLLAVLPMLHCRELVARVLFTIFAVAFIRFGQFLPLPGIDPSLLQSSGDAAASASPRLWNPYSGKCMHKARASPPTGPRLR
jgi:preprotein translocase subunit SecY